MYAFSNAFVGYQALCARHRGAAKVKCCGENLVLRGRPQHFTCSAPELRRVKRTSRRTSSASRAEAPALASSVSSLHNKFCKDVLHVQVTRLIHTVIFSQSILVPALPCSAHSRT